MTYLTVKALAEKTGLSGDTIRFYEKKSLIKPTLRGDNNYRYYDEDAYKKLLFIKHCRDLGISIQDIVGLNELLKHPEQNCHSVNDMVDRHLLDVEQKIQALLSFQTQLQTLRQSCTTERRIADCQIIKTLSDE